MYFFMAFVALCLFLLVFANLKKNKRIENCRRSVEIINHLPIGMTKNEVLKILGEPSIISDNKFVYKYIWAEEIGEPHYSLGKIKQAYIKQNFIFEILFKDDKIESIICNNKQIK